MAKYLVVGQHSWTRNEYYNRIQHFPEHDWYYYFAEPDCIAEYIEEIKPDKVFFMHWSHIVPDSIVNNYECICFHPSHLPYGRGGTPIQNLISRGFRATKLTAFKMIDELDAGPIYLQQDLDLSGSAQDIYIRIARMSADMIKAIINYNVQPNEQVGEPTLFKRRKPEDSLIVDDLSIEQLFDHIRMLSADNYPAAFIECGKYRITFFDPDLSENSVLAHAEIELIND